VDLKVDYSIYLSLKSTSYSDPAACSHNNIELTGRLFFPNRIREDGDAVRSFGNVAAVQILLENLTASATFRHLPDASSFSTYLVRSVSLTLKGTPCFALVMEESTDKRCRLGCDCEEYEISARQDQLSSIESLSSLCNGSVLELNGSVNRLRQKRSEFETLALLLLW